MKRITVKGRTIYRTKSDGKVVRTTFEKGQAYEVADAVAEAPLMKERLASVEDLSEAKPKKKARAAEDTTSTITTESMEARLSSTWSRISERKVTAAMRGFA